MNTRNMYAAFCTLLALGLSAPLAAAQQQLFELAKEHFPVSRENSRAVVAADFDKDGDLDLLIGNNEVVSGNQNRLYLNDGKGDFIDVTVTHLPVGIWHTHSIAVGDVDADGDLDFVTGDTWQNRLFLNDGTGKFQDATFGRMPTHRDETRRVLLLDVDGDLDLDIICANYRQETLYLNDGSGTFTDVTSSHLPVDQVSTWSVAAADIDKDGDLDLMFANHLKSALYRNDGTGKFTDVSSSQLPSLPLSAGSTQFGDVDGDGDFDIFLGFWSKQALLLLNDGAGSFALAPSGNLPATRTLHWQSRLADVDGDQDLDIVYSTIREDQIFLNDGSGKFTDATAQLLPPISTATLDFLLADLDGDQDLDLATAEAGQPTRLMFNDGQGKFANATPFALEMPWIGARSFALGDIDKDGDLDMVTAGGDYGEAIEEDGLLLGDGYGRFLPAPAGNLPSILDDTTSVALADVDKDGDLDLVLGNDGEQNRLFLNDGTGKFSDVTASHMPAAMHRTQALAFGDVDKDGDLDLVLACMGEQSRLYLNNGGVFTDATASRLPALVRESRDVKLFDADKDGDLDILLANGLTAGQVQTLLRNDGSGTFVDVSASTLPTRWSLRSACLAIGDVDADGDLDVIVGNDGLGSGIYNALYRNDGAGNFAAELFVYDYYRTHAILLVDIDDDGDLDVVCGDYDHYDKLYLNDGTGDFMNVSWPRLDLRPNRTSALAAADVDGDGDMDVLRGSDWTSSSLLTNHHRQIASSRLARIGQTWPLELQAMPGYASQVQLALPWLAFAPGNVPLAPFGTLGLDPLTMFPLPAVALPFPSGKASLPLPIPNGKDFVGKRLYAQALILHGPGFESARFTNVLVEEIVR